MNRLITLFSTLLLISTFGFTDIQSYDKKPGPAGSGLEATVDQDTIKLRVLTYNIYHGATTKGDFDLDTIANRFLAHNPDLIAMQEVDRLTNRAHKLDLVTELGLRTKMAPLFGRAMYYDSGEYGEGILSKFSFVQSKNIPLPASPKNEPRAALEVLLELPTGDTIAFVATHFDHTRDSKDRNDQARMLMERYKKFPYPVILAGDLNATPDSEAITTLTQEFQMSARDKVKPTHPSDDPMKKIDYILLDRDYNWKVLESVVIQDQIVSDHCGYLAVIQLIIERNDSY